MFQILQSLKTGETMLAEVSAPMVLPGELLIATHSSLVSAVTERMLVDFGKSGWLQNVRSQPVKVKAVIEKIKVDPGVSSAEFSPGDRVVSFCWDRSMVMPEGPPFKSLQDNA